MPIVAHVEVQLLAGDVLPAPAIIVVTFTDADTGALVNCANADLRRLNPVGDYGSLALLGVSTGTYHAGSLADPVTHAIRGSWLYEARSTVLGDLCEPAQVPLEIVADAFPPITVPGPVGGDTHPQQDVPVQITQPILDAGIPLQVPLLFQPTGANAAIAGGGDVSNLVTWDGVHFYVTLALSDGVNPSPFVAGDVVIIRAVQ
jgi:hypothetical protein